MAFEGVVEEKEPVTDKSTSKEVAGLPKSLEDDFPALVKLVGKEALTDPKQRVIDRFSQGSRLIGLSDLHHESGRVGREWSCQLISDLISQNKINCLFIELPTVIQRDLDLYLSGNITYEEFRSAATSHYEMAKSFFDNKASVKGHDLNLGLANMLPVLEVCKGKVSVLCFDVREESNGKGDLAMWRHVVGTMEDQPQLIGAVYAGGEHIKRKVNSSYSLVNAGLDQMGYLGLDIQSGVFGERLTMASAMIGNREPILLWTGDTFLHKMREHKNDVLPIGEQYQGVVVFPNQALVSILEKDRVRTD